MKKGSCQFNVYTSNVSSKIVKNFFFLYTAWSKSDRKIATAVVKIKKLLVFLLLPSRKKTRLR